MVLEDKRLDFQQTKQNIIRVVQKYDRCLTRLGSGSRPTITANYTMDIPSQSTEFNSKVENAVIYEEVDSLPDDAYVRRVKNVLNSMRKDYRTIIIMSFFDNKLNTAISLEIGVGSNKLSIMKREAMELFAYGMGVEKYERSKN